MADWIGAAEAAERLGVKPATLYSYVSRGVLRRRRAPGGRGSHFDPGEVEALSRRGRPRREARLGEFVIESGLTEIAGDRLRFRGMDAAELAVQRSFEEVAALLWTGSFASTEAAGLWHAGPWQATAEAMAAGTAAQSALPAGTLPLERLQVIVPALAAADPLRLRLDPPAVIGAARSIIAGMVDCLPAAHARRGTPPADDTVAARLWPRLWPRCAPPWSCSPTTNWPRRRSLPGWRRRCGPTPTRWSPPDSARWAARCTAGRRWPPRRCSRRPASRPTPRASWANCSAEGSAFPASAILSTTPVTRGPCSCSAWSGGPPRHRPGWRWPTPCSPRCAGAPCPSRTSTSPGPCWPVWRG